MNTFLKEYLSLDRGGKNIVIGFLNDIEILSLFDHLSDEEQFNLFCLLPINRQRSFFIYLEESEQRRFVEQVGWLTLTAIWPALDIGQVPDSLCHLKKSVIEVFERLCQKNIDLSEAE